MKKTEWETCLTVFSAKNEPCRVEENNRELGVFSPGEERAYILPAGEVSLSVWDICNYAHPIWEEVLFFAPSERGTIVLGEEGASFLPAENLPVMAEKGHFRILNMTRNSICAKRKTGASVIETIPPNTYSPYRMAGMGGYTLYFYEDERELGEVSFSLSEAQALLLIVTGKDVLLLTERDIKKRR